VGRIANVDQYPQLENRFRDQHEPDETPKNPDRSRNDIVQNNDHAKKGREEGNKQRHVECRIQNSRHVQNLFVRLEKMKTALSDFVNKL